MARLGQFSPVIPIAWTGFRGERVLAALPVHSNRIWQNAVAIRWMSSARSHGPARAALAPQIWRSASRGTLGVSAALLSSPHPTLSASLCGAVRNCRSHIQGLAQEGGKVDHVVESNISAKQTGEAGRTIALSV